MTRNTCPTSEFVTAARAAINEASRTAPEIAQEASSILIDLASFRPLSRTLYAGHEVLLTQDRVTLTVMYGDHAEGVKKGVLDIFTNARGFDRLPEREFHR